MRVLVAVLALSLMSVPAAAQRAVASFPFRPVATVLPPAPDSTANAPAPSIPRTVQVADPALAGDHAMSVSFSQADRRACGRTFGGWGLLLGLGGGLVLAEYISQNDSNTGNERPISEYVGAVGGFTVGFGLIGAVAGYANPGACTSP